MRLISLGLLLVARVAPGGAEVKYDHASFGFKLSEGLVAFKVPYEMTGSDGLQWMDNDYYYFWGDYYFGDYSFDYYYQFLEDAVTNHQLPLILGGVVTDGFVCNGNQKLDTLNIEPAFVDSRRLQLSTAYYYQTWWDTAHNYLGSRDYYYYFEDYYDPFAGNEGSENGEHAVSVEVKSVQTYDLSFSLEAVPGTSIRFSKPSLVVSVTQQPHDGPMHAEGLAVETGLVFDYECFGTGQSLVEVRLLVQGAGKPKEEVCVNWIKQCSFSLPPFVAIEDDYMNTIVSESKPVPEAKFLTQPVKDSFNFFYVRMTEDGLLRLRPPDIYVGSSGIGDVDMRLEDSENTYMEVSRTRTRVTVSYTCHQKGILPVYMLLQRDWSSFTEILEVRWEKVCEGRDAKTVVPALGAMLGSETYGNQTQAIANGKTLREFMRPCPRPGAARTRHEDENHTGILYRDPPANCVDRVPKFLVPRGDSETVVNWKWASGDSAPEMLDTVIGYNARLMEAKISNDWRRYKSSVSYQCFADGIGNVTVTLYIRGMPPMDIAWRKKCTEPRAPRTGKTLTTKIAIGVVLWLLFMLTCCGLVTWWVIRKTWDWRRASDSEKASIVGNVTLEED